MAARSEGRHPFREAAELGRYIVRNWFKPSRKSMVPYSIQWSMRFRPAWFRHDLLTLLDLLKQSKIKPLIAQRLPLEEARRAHEMLGEGGVLGKIVLLLGPSRHRGRNGEGHMAIVKEFAAKIGVSKLAPHDLRRSCARLCRAAGGELEQIQFLLGHVSVQTTERYLGCTQRIASAVNDRIGIEPKT